MFEFDEKAALAGNEAQGGSKVLDTGVYDVEILTASKTVASTGSIGIDWSLQVEGSKYPNMVYGMWIQKINGDKIFNMDILQGLMGLIGVKKLTEYNKDIDVKDGTKTVIAFKELDNIKVKVAIQKILDVYNDEVSEKNEIKAFFNENGKTYAEQVRNSEAKQIEYYQTKLQDKETPKYKKFMADIDPDEEAEEAESGSSLL